MAAIKVVVLFQQVSDFASPLVSVPVIGYASRQHLGGWSESMWFDGTVADCLTALKSGLNGAPGLLPSRAKLLGNGADIIGIRLYQTGSGKGQSYGLAYPGDPTNTTDVPQMAILCKTGPLNAAVTRRFTLRGVPDLQVTAGEFAPAVFYAAAISQYFYALSNFSFYGVNPASPKPPILNITAAGLVTLAVPLSPFLPNDLVTISKTIDAVGNFVTYTAPVLSIGPAANQFTITGWTHGVTQKGNATTKVKALFGMNWNNSVVVRAVVRKVGRPFEQYRGRRSKRR